MTVDDVMRLIRWRNSGGLIVPQYLIRTSLSGVALRLSHKDVFGRPLSDREMIERVQGLSRSAMLSAIGQFALRVSVASPSDRALQRRLICEMLPAVTAARVRTLLEKRPTAVAFDPQGAMILAKLVLRHSQEKGHSPQHMRDAFDALPSLMLTAADALDARFDEVNKTQSEQAGPKWLENHIIRMMAFSASPRYGGEAARYSRMFLQQAYEERARCMADWIDIRAAFAGIVGYGLEEYLAAGLALVAFQMPKGGAVDPLRACIRPRRWLEGFPTGRGRQVMTEFLKSLSAPASELRRRIPRTLGMEFFFDFSLFEEKPLVRLPGGLVCTIWHQWLCEAVTSGVYWRLRHGLGPKPKQQFCSFVGQLFEMYVSDLLKSCLPEHSVFPAKLAPKRGGADFAVFLGQDAFFVEAATSHLQKKGTEVQAQASAVDRDLTDLARKAGQALDSALDFADGRTRYAGIAARAMRRIWPVLVTLHHAPVDPFTLRRLRQDAVQGRPPRQTIQPPIFVDVAELEDLCSLVESGQDLRKVIREWASDIDHHEWPLANFLSARGTKRPLVRLLQEELRRLVDAAHDAFGQADP
jgi:hypothetical protein